MEKLRRKFKDMEAKRGDGGNVKEKEEDKRRDLEEKVKELERWKEMKEKERRRNIVIKRLREGKGLEKRSRKIMECVKWE